MDLQTLPDLRPVIDELAGDIEALRQNRLLDETAFIRFAKDRGIGVSGVIQGEPGEFHRSGWLGRDGAKPDGRPLFHPFRIYPLYHILRVIKPQLSASTWLRPKETIVRLLDQILPYGDPATIGRNAIIHNRVVDLAVLLEAVYWPRIAGREPARVPLNRKAAYESRMRTLVRTLDRVVWRSAHEELRRDAAILDDNPDLYLLLRLADWRRRERLNGSFAGALWLRHMAEVLRRAFEDAFGEAWPEEDEAFGEWPPGARSLVYGSERPLDDELRSSPYLAHLYGVFTGSAVSWYVEGETEYFAVLELLPDPASHGVDLVNLGGEIASERANSALKLEGSLKRDKEVRRFSVISFDRDVPANVRAIRNQVRAGNVVGFIAAHTPDFEFANFSLEELIEVAARIDEAHGGSGDATRRADWPGVTRAADFESRYRSVSSVRPRSLKGEEWGRALAAYARENPRRRDTNTLRPFLREIEIAIRARTVNYNHQRENWEFDPESFMSRRKESRPALPSTSETPAVPQADGSAESGVPKDNEGRDGTA